MARAEKDGLFRSIVEAALAQKWTVDKTTSQHWRLVPPDKTKKICIFSGSPSSPSALRNFISEMRRNGFVPPKRAHA